MPYVAFLDMVGSKSAASISNKEYQKSIYEFNCILNDIGSQYDASIYAYSDNAYIELKDLENMLSFFQVFRQQLLLKHRYFSAAIDHGKLENVITNNSDIEHERISMMFTNPKIINIYLKQCDFSGIGFHISNSIVDELKKHSLDDKIRYSIYQSKPIDNIENYKVVADLAYLSVDFEHLSFIISDYIINNVLNKRAGRYYITPIITMIKCLNKDEIEKNLENIVKLITLQKVPFSVKSEAYNKMHIFFFLYSLIDTVLLIYKSKHKAYDICSKIIEISSIDPKILLEELANIPMEIISNLNKRYFIKIIVEIYSHLNI